MSFASGVWRVLKKELTEARRDRSLMISAVLVPLFLPPLLGFGAFQVLQIIQGMSERETPVVVIDEALPTPLANRILELDRLEIIQEPISDEDSTPEAFRARRAESVEAPPQVLLDWRDAQALVVLHDASSERSQDSKRRLLREVDSWREEIVRSKMTDVGLTPLDFDLFEVDADNVASATQTGRYVLSIALPFFMLLMLATGTYYAALDTVVGERERTTLESLLVSPLERGQILVGKYLFVVIASLVAVLLNLGSVTIFMKFLFSIMGLDDISISLSPVAFLIIVGVSILTAAFLAAVMMVIVVPSKTYREGQAVLSPVYMIPMLPGLVVMTSTDPFSVEQAWVPLLNVAATYESVLKGDLPTVPIFITFAVCAGLAALAVFFAARIVSREDVFLDPKMSLKDLLLKKGSTR